MYVTKVQALMTFKARYANTLKSNSQTDKRALWNDYTDFLQKQGLINERQWRTWTNPFK